MRNILDGKQFAAKIIEQIKIETVSLNQNQSVCPGLAVILVGNDPASEIYVRAKNRMAKECGFYFIAHHLDSNIKEEKLLHLIQSLNQNSHIHGILIQMPLPPHIDTYSVIQTISPDKDVDGFHCINVGKSITSTRKDGFVSCTPAGIMVMIRYRHGSDLSGMNAVVVGRSNTVGKPIANLLLAANATVTIAHSHTSSLPDIIRDADILIAATGQAEMIKGSWIKPGATVIDVGITRIGKDKIPQNRVVLVGDVEYNAASLVAGAITPVPGGVGPMTVTMLMANTLKAACLSIAMEPPVWCF